MHINFWVRGYYLPLGKIFKEMAIALATSFGGLVNYREDDDLGRSCHVAFRAKVNIQEPLPRVPLLLLEMLVLNRYFLSMKSFLISVIDVELKMTVMRMKTRILKDDMGIGYRHHLLKLIEAIKTRTLGARPSSLQIFWTKARARSQDRTKKDKRS